MPSCKQTRVAGRSVPVRCAGAAQLLVEHAQLLVGMPIRVFSLWTVCVLSSRLFRGHGDVLHSRQRCPLIPLVSPSSSWGLQWTTNRSSSAWSATPPPKPKPLLRALPPNAPCTSYSFSASLATISRALLGTSSTARPSKIFLRNAAPPSALSTSSAGSITSVGSYFTPLRRGPLRLGPRDACRHPHQVCQPGQVSALRQGPPRLLNL